ncbi:MAG: ATP-binding protein [Anaerolineae bacterium]|nr:ATP-binding protein [Anaerolineae bacterium]MDW8171854.1 ATP-binding protein [Anaerolineae bacterium]
MLNATRGQDWAFYGLRWVLLLGLAALVLLARGAFVKLASFSLSDHSDLLLALVIGGVANGLIGVALAVKPLSPYALLLMPPTDWIIAFAFTSVSAATPSLWFAIAASLILLNVVRLGPPVGLASSAILALMVLVALHLQGAVSVLPPLRLPAEYTTALLALALVTLSSATASSVLNIENTARSRKLEKASEEATARANAMRERVKAVADMATQLISTTDYQRILDITTDIGRLCVRRDPKQHRLVSITLLVESDNELTIATARGLQHIDSRRTFKGERGILARTIREGVPKIVSTGGSEDEELCELVAFSNVESILCIPLRAGFDTFGVLVYASTEQDAFNEDNLDAMQAIGVQATIALQNSFLYRSLMDEKERLIRIEENARKALVRDLHDIPTQTISAVVMQLPTLLITAQRQPQALAEEVEKLRSMAQRAVEEIRHVMFALRPLALETSGLTSALNQLAEKMGKTYGQNMRVAVDPDVEMNLTQEQQGTLFYLIEEASNNARKHAQAPLIDVRVSLNEQGVVVRIQDNGKGFDMNAVGQNYEGRGSFGMVNMQERAQLIGGRLEMRSAPGKGTLIVVNVPLKEVIRASKPPAPAAASPDGRKRIARSYTGPLSPNR